MHGLLCFLCLLGGARCFNSLRHNPFANHALPFPNLEGCPDAKTPIIDARIHQFAVMRKLLHQIYGILKSGQPYNPEKRGFAAS